MSYDLMGAMKEFVQGFAPVLGGSLDGINAMSMDFSSANLGLGE